MVQRSGDRLVISLPDGQRPCRVWWGLMLVRGEGGLAGLMLVAGCGGEAGQAGSRVAARQKEQKVGKSCKIFAFRYLIKTPGV